MRAGLLWREAVMGMFDHVRCELPLPDGFTGELQSKDFDCAMTEVVIGRDGRLRIEVFEHESVPKTERPYPDAEKGSIWALCGAIRKVNRRWLDLDYHGDFNFYGSEGTAGTPEYRWHEYVARFTDGALTSIRQIGSDHD